MKAEKQELIKIYTTPKQLRALADQMEKKWSDLPAGESVRFIEIELDNMRIEIYFDQAKMHRGD